MTRHLFYWPLQSFVPAIILFGIAGALALVSTGIDHSQAIAERKAKWTESSEIVATYSGDDCQSSTVEGEIVIRCAIQ